MCVELSCPCVLVAYLLSCTIEMLSVGDRVRIQGLKSDRALHLNQTYGLVTSYVKEKQRYRVHLDRTLAHGLFREENLIHDEIEGISFHDLLSGSYPSIDKKLTHNHDSKFIEPHSTQVTRH